MLYEKLKILWSLFMDGIELSQEPLQGDSLLYTSESPGVPGTHLIIPEQ